MKVLVACEFSGVVRDAFRKLGHDAWSCDLLPCDGDPQYHYQMDVLQLLDNSAWDLMIAHPPCTFMSNSGAKHLYLNGKKTNGRDEQRWRELAEGAEFFQRLWNAKVPRIAIENPIMVGHAKKIIGVEQSQTFQPWMFGHKEFKATCLWLKGLPLLERTCYDLIPPESGTEEHKKWSRVHMASPGPNRWKERSRTLQGPADAMADQWGRSDAGVLIDKYPVIGTFVSEVTHKEAGLCDSEGRYNY